jgi:hypothetical protein
LKFKDVNRMAQCICCSQRLSKAALHIVAWLGISSAHAAEPADQSIAGAYEILICDGACATARDENALVKGVLVLFPTNLQPHELAREHLSGGHFMRGDLPNGCFGLEKVPGAVYDGYAGFEKVGLTAWSIEGDELRFALYHSPDAGYRVTVQRTTSGFAGSGKSLGAGVAALKGSTLDKVVLRRTGAASLSQCPREMGTFR